MMENANSETARTALEARLEEWTQAVRRQDLDEIMGFYLPDVVAFDAIQSLQFKGVQAYRDHWKVCLDMCGPGMAFTALETDVQVQGDLAVLHALIRCAMDDEAGKPADAGYARCTSSWRRVGGQWKIAHEHFSVPFDMKTGRALCELNPEGAANHVRPIPLGMNTVIPHIVCAGAAKALEFYKAAFGAVEESRLEMQGSIAHACIRIEGSPVFIMDEAPQWGAKGPLTLNGSPVSMHLYVRDVDAAMQKAIAAGATQVMAVQDMFWGDRYGVVADPFGHQWSLATHIKDLSQDEILAASKEMMDKMCQADAAQAK